MDHETVSESTASTLEVVGEASGEADVSGITDTLIDDELLIEEISIDGMCGVY